MKCRSLFFHSSSSNNWIIRRRIFLIGVIFSSFASRRDKLFWHVVKADVVVVVVDVSVVVVVVAIFLKLML